MEDLEFARLVWIGLIGFAIGLLYLFWATSDNHQEALKTDRDRSDRLTEPAQKSGS